MSDRIGSRRERIREMADSLCPGKRYEAANAYVQAARDVREILGIEVKPDQYHDFLSGWDAAMELLHDELLEENKALHGIILDLCTRMCIERCKVCRGEGIDEDLEPCPHCDGGWIDKP